MTSTAFDDQFAVCTPEEEEFFRERQAQKDDALISQQCAHRAEDAAIEAINKVIHGPGHNTREDRCRALYAAIRDGRIPGVVLGGGHE